MIPSVLSLALAYVFLLFLLLLLLVRSEVGTGFKFLLVALGCGFYLWHFMSMQSFIGWPANDRLPRHFELVSSLTLEPDPDNGEDGGIFLWLRDLEGGQQVPRAYRLPYHKPLHRKVEKTLKQQRQGQRFIGRPVPRGGGRPQDIEFEKANRDTGSLKPAPVQ